MNRIALFLILLSLFVSKAPLRSAKGYSVENNYVCKIEFINPDNNIIRGNIQSLDMFYEELFRLKSTVQTKDQVSVFHLGDSHLQAGFLSGTVMKDFHRDFGNAGRGLIIPLKLARTNEPNDYSILSSSTWDVTRCVSSRLSSAVGIGGVTIRSRESSPSIEIKTGSNLGISYEFNKVRIFHSPESTGRFKLSNNNISVVSSTTPAPFLSEFLLNKGSESVKFEAKQAGTSPISLYGISLENGSKGVLYHSVGLNGAQFLHYKRIAEFGNQIRMLSPQLIIFSLGTNEAFKGNITKEQIMKEIASLIDPIRVANPKASILLTTPAECQYKTTIRGETQYKPNPNIEIVCQAITSYAEANNHPYWDLFALSGGAGSSEAWVNSGMLARDRVHFNVSGYKMQGELLYQALINGYNQYVSRRIK